MYPQGKARLWLTAGSTLTVWSMQHSKPGRLMLRTVCTLPALHFISQHMFTQREHGEDCRPNNPCLHCAAVETQSWLWEQLPTVIIHPQKSFPHNNTSTNGERRGSTAGSSAVSSVRLPVMCCDRMQHKLFWLDVNPLNGISLSSCCYTLLGECI